MNIKETAKEIYENAKAKGFWDTERNLGEMLMLIVSELSEALEADRTGHYCNQDRRDLIDSNDYDSYSSTFETYIKNTFEDELADVVIRVLDLCHAKNIDLEWHIRNKMKYNSMREHKHGKKY